MSFIDQLAKNLNTQTEFFTQLSNISKDARAKSSEPKPEIKVQQKPELKTQKDSTESSNTIEQKEKKEFEIPEKEGFFTTAKKVFKEYKVKVDEAEDKKEPDLKEELETADQALDLIFGLVDPQLQAQLELQAQAPKPDLTAALEALDLKHEAPEPDPELLDFFLDRIDIKLSTEIETLTKEIVNLDLNTEEGITEILEISNDIESLQNIEKAIAEIKVDLKELINQEAQTISDKEIKPEVELLLEAKIEAKLGEMKQAGIDNKIEVKQHEPLKQTELEATKEIKLDLKAEIQPKVQLKPDVQLKPEVQLNLAGAEIALEEPEADNIKKVLDEVKANLKRDRAVNASTIKKPETNLNNFNVKVLQDTEVKAQTNKTLDYTKAQVEVVETISIDTFADSSKDSDLSSDNFETLFPREVKVSNIKVKTLSQPVAIRHLPELITKEAQEVKPGTKQELRMILDPGNLGKMQLSLTREDNQIHISMIVRTDEAQTKLEQKINDIRAVLKDKGFEANIEVTKSDTNNSNSSQQNQGNTSQGNEAKERQKEKYLNQVPQWIAKDIEKLDFKEALNRAL